jgi:TolB-like protein/Tfp pilus assembly protein PilF
VTDTPAEGRREGIWTKLHRRKVVQWSVVYLACGWSLLQGVGFVADAFAWPGAVKQVATLVLLIGLPIVLVLAWYHGDRGQQQVTATELSILAVLFLLGGALLWHYQLRPSAVEIEPSAGSQARAAVPPDDNSIAVLPFADMSAERNQEYMSDGIAEELLNRLARVRNLKVIARTSSFAFKDRNVEIAEIGQKLNVAYVLEGGVRRSSNKVRITARLIRTADSTFLWSEDYDRTLDDIFAVQEEIAGAIVQELQIQLMGGQSSQRTGGTIAAPPDAEAYSWLLEARYVLRQSTEENIRRAEDLVERALARDPKYADAWVDLAVVHMRRYEQARTVAAKEEALGSWQSALDRALALDPELADAHARMSRLHRLRWDFGGAERSMKRALELAPGSIDVVLAAAGLASTFGRFDEAIALQQRAVELDPLSGSGWYNLAFRYLAAGRPADAEIPLKTLLEMRPDDLDAHSLLGDAYLLQGRAEAALAEYEREADPAARLAGRAMAEHALGHADSSSSALGELIATYGDQAKPIAEVYAYRSEIDEAFEWLERAYATRDPDLAYLKPAWFLTRLHGDPRWATLLKKIGLPPE